MIQFSRQHQTITFLGMILCPQLLIGAPPVITEAQILEMNKDAVSKASAAKAAKTAAQSSLQSDVAIATAASKDVTTFLAQADLPIPPADDEPTTGKPLEITPGPKDTVINCTGGMYFDADAGILVYLKDVTVNDPRYDLTGADELKIFFTKKSATSNGAVTSEKTSEVSETEIGDDIGAKFGDVERIIATGAVRLNQKAAPGKEPIKASGRIFTYHLKEDRILLSGGYPWFTQGTTYMRAMQPDLTLQLFPKTGSFVTEGNWQMGGNLEQKSKDSN